MPGRTVADYEKEHARNDIPIASDFDTVNELFRVRPGEAAGLIGRDTAWAGNNNKSKKDRRKKGEEILSDGVAELTRQQEMLWADDSWSVLAIFQAMDAAGKDGAIKHVMSGVNPQGVEVTSFKHPSAEDLDRIDEPDKH